MPRLLQMLGVILALLMAFGAPALAQQRVVGRTALESPPPQWPQSPRPPANAPNVLLIMTDDVGFGAASAFGGPVPTPTFDMIARAGLRYNRFSTAAICSPTRASLLTGRNPHNVGVGLVTNLPTGYEGYSSVIPASAGTIAQVLRARGFNTAMFGKGHVTPEWEQSAAGPFDRWPTGLGFEHFYGFLGADVSAFAPTLVRNTTAIAPPQSADYHFEADIADDAVGWIRQQQALAPNNPFFIYYAPGAAHAPNHAPEEWLAGFRGQFDGGWDQMREDIYRRQLAQRIIPVGTELAPRPPQLPAWDTLSADQRRLYARYMEAYAASLSYADAQIGRVVEAIRDTGELDNTLIIYIQGDNGASTEGRLDGKLFEQSGVNNVAERFDYVLSNIDDIGGPNAYNLYPGGWGWAMNAPFAWYKRVASHFGGTRNAMVMSWPRRIRDAGGQRGQFHFVSDVMPTILEAAGVEAPMQLNGVAQQPIDGVSMLYSVANASAPSRRTRQVFEVMQNFAIYDDGWVAASRPVGTPWDATPAPAVSLNQRVWELFNVNTDFSQAHNLAAAEPQRLAALQDLFWSEAARNRILPIHAPNEGAEGVPSLTNGRTSFTFYPGVTRVPERAAPPVMRRTFSISADIVVPEGGAHGVLVTQGGRFGGYALYFMGSHPVFHYNAIGERQYNIRAADPLPPGRHRLVTRFRADSAAAGAGGEVTISLGRRVLARGRVDATLSSWMSHTDGFDVGEDTLTPINGDYTIAQSRFSGTLERLTIDLE
ncbi:sulfatase precursor [alpha proteobacterium U9-1i]|nr:sulfatase precursor [alpha proteobacterium U9-1i]